MVDIQRTPEFIKWLRGLKDKNGKARIETRIARLGLGLPGDMKVARDGVSEMRIDSGPGYRVYLTKRGPTLIVLLAGGDKSTQDKDIETAVRMARNL